MVRIRQPSGLLSSHSDSIATFSSSKLSQVMSFVSTTSVSHKFVSKTMWRQRLGHPCNKVLSTVLGCSNVNNLSTMNEKVSFCKACQYEKSQSLPFKKTLPTTKQPLEIIYCDL